MNNKNNISVNIIVAIDSGWIGLRNTNSKPNQTNPFVKKIIQIRSETID